MSTMLRGISGSPGLRLGTIAQIHAAQPDVRDTHSSEDDQLEQFTTAQREVAAQLEHVGAELRAEDKQAEAAIFDAQALLALDPTLTAEVTRLIQTDALAPAAAVEQVTAALAATLSALDDPYLQGRAADITAVGQQIISVLRGESAEFDLPPQAIVVAHDFTPAQIAALRNRDIAGIAAASGGPTGHVAILARALNLPAVLGLGDDLMNVPHGTTGILDANAGTLTIAPTPAELANYEREHTAEQVAEEQRRLLLTVPAQTKDNHRIRLWANIGQPDEAQLALAQGAEGIGLFRTEFLFLDRATPPSEAEQVAAYREVLRIMDGRPVIVRTLDVGGDKPIPYLAQPHESNPFLGARGIRFAMRFPDLFTTHVRALLRAAHHGDLRIMFPMVATPDDVAWARQQIENAAAALQREGIEHRADPPLGIMIETPAAAIALDRLTNGIRFCSIGSNDLAQYTLAADRSDAALAQQYSANNPAVLRFIHTSVEAAQRLGLEISLCGELAADPTMSIALAGLGLDKLSMTPSALLRVKEALQSVTLEEAQQRAVAACDEARPDAQANGTRTGTASRRRKSRTRGDT